MKIFNKRAVKIKPEKENVLMKRLMILLEGAATVWANRMTRYSSGLSRKCLKMCLGLFVLITGGYSLYLMITGIATIGQDPIRDIWLPDSRPQVEKKYQQFKNEKNGKKRIDTKGKTSP